MGTKLPEDFKQKWVEALMSGKYKQGQFILRHKEKYCCLGVAADLCGIKNIEGEGIVYSHVARGSNFPKLLIGTGDNPVVCGLSDMNDSGVPFEVIAGFIQEYL